MAQAGPTNKERGTAARRRRDLLLLCAALALHGVILALVPGMSLPVSAPAKLLIELTSSPTELEPVSEPSKPVADTSASWPKPKANPAKPNSSNGTSHQATAPIVDSTIRSGGRGVPNLPKKPASGSPAKGDKPGSKPQPAGGQHDPGKSPGAPAGKPQPPAANASDSTDVSAKTPITSTNPAAPPAPKPPASSKAAGKSQGQGSDPAAKPKSARPKGEPDAAGTGDAGAGESKPSASKSAKPASNGGSNTSNGGGGGGPAKARGNGAGDSGSGNGGGGSNGPGKGGDGDGKGTGPATALEKGPPATPSGPSDGELRLLDDYGANWRKKIRQLARTPEIAREKDHRGKVSFQFTVSRNGRLLGVSILNSPGFKELEEECKEATRVAGQSDVARPFPGAVSVEKWTFTMSLTFPIS